MKKNELASVYLREYRGLDVTITDVTIHEELGVCVYDLSDGTHWLADNGDTGRTVESLTDERIGWDEADGWVVIGENGDNSPVEFI